MRDELDLRQIALEHPYTAAWKKTLCTGNRLRQNNNNNINSYSSRIVAQNIYSPPEAPSSRAPSGEAAAKLMQMLRCRGILARTLARSRYHYHHHRGVDSILMK